MTRRAVLAVDGGGSKVDVALIGRGGDLAAVARARSRDPSHGSDYLEAIVEAVTSRAHG